MPRAIFSRGAVPAGEALLPPDLRRRRGLSRTKRRCPGTGRPRAERCSSDPPARGHEPRCARRRVQRGPFRDPRGGARLAHNLIERGGNGRLPHVHVASSTCRLRPRLGPLRRMRGQDLRELPPDPGGRVKGACLAETGWRDLRERRAIEASTSPAARAQTASSSRAARSALAPAPAFAATRSSTGRAQRATRPSSPCSP